MPTFGGRSLSLNYLFDPFWSCTIYFHSFFCGVFFVVSFKTQKANWAAMKLVFPVPGSAKSYLLRNQLVFTRSKKSPTGPTNEPTPKKPEYLIARSQLTERGPLVKSHSIFDENSYSSTKGTWKPKANQFLMDKKLFCFLWMFPASAPKHPRRMVGAPKKKFFPKDRREELVFWVKQIAQLRTKPWFVSFMNAFFSVFLVQWLSQWPTFKTFWGLHDYIFNRKNKVSTFISWSFGYNYIYYIIWIYPPPRMQSSPPGLWTIFRIGDPNLNLHFPLLLGGG